MNLISLINKILLAIFLVAMPIIINRIYLESKDDYIVFLNIGQGDSTLVCNKYNDCGLIDTGKQASVVDRIKNYTNKPLEFLLLTHPDADHISQTKNVIEQIGVKKVFFGNTTKGQELIQQILNKSVRIFELREDNDFYFGQYKFDVLWPSRNIDLNLIESNDSSTTLVVSNNNLNLFTAGDLGTELEEKVSQNQELTVNILKLSHHGSKNSSSIDFLSRVYPKLGIISVGKNSYGHPSYQAIDNLEKLDIKYLRTDLDGDIKIDIFKEKLDISTQISKKSYIILN